MHKTDVTIIGAGVIGLAISVRVCEDFQNIVVIEKNLKFGQESSSRNSEVIHSGIYYPQNSLKSKTCIQGRNLLYQYCRKNNIPFKKLGKLIVAEDKEEEQRLWSIYKNGIEVGIKNLKILERKDIKKIEPHIEAELGIFSPDTGILDSHQFMKSLYNEAKLRGVIFSFSSEVVGIQKRSTGYLITIKDADGKNFSFLSKIVINSAGLFSDRIAQMLGINDYKIYYCKGQYFRIRNPAKYNINHLIYPPPTEISLGIHITPDIAGGIRLGPDAFYVRKIDYSVNENDRERFYYSVKKFLPELNIEDIIPDTAGIRPKLQKENGPFKDFVIRDEADKGFPGFIDLIGIESPGLTASLSIAEEMGNILRQL